MLRVGRPLACLLCLSMHREVKSEEERKQGTKTSRLFFLGTGSSIGTPSLIHLMMDHPSGKYAKNRDVCRKASRGDPRHNKNYRCNPSLVIQHGIDTPEGQNIVIDTGKTFREAAVRWFPVYQVKTVDAVVLTHGHADAIFGLDDIRSVQPIGSDRKMPIYLSEECETVVRRVFEYLFPGPPLEGSSAVHRFVSSVECRRIQHNDRFEVCGISILPFSVLHGEDLLSMGFLFGNRGQVCYISDISRMPQDSLQILKGSGPIDLLIVDALLPTGRHPTHFSVEQAVDLCRELRPKRALFVGMSSSVDHEECNAYLDEIGRTEGLNMQLAYDGLSVDVDL